MVSVEIISGIIISGIVAVYALRVYSLNVLQNKLFKESQRLQALMNRFKTDMEKYGGPTGMVEGGLESLGIDGILQALQLDPDKLISMLPSKYKMFGPVIKGFIEGASKKKKGENAIEIPSGFM